MDPAEFDYQLHHELIAQTPLADRAASRMLVLYRSEDRWEDRAFRELPGFLGPGDCLVLNEVECALLSGAPIRDAAEARAAKRGTSETGAARIHAYGKGAECLAEAEKQVLKKRLAEQ